VLREGGDVAVREAGSPTVIRPGGMTTLLRSETPAESPGPYTIDRPISVTSGR
jgi:hypothetical protein